MTIEKQVNLKLQVQRPRDGAALADASDQAKRLSTEFRGVGEASGRAMAEASNNAKRMQNEFSRGKDAVTQLNRELGRSAREARGVTQIAEQLQRFGVAADAARQHAQRLFRTMGDGARVAEADVRRLATAIRATQQGGAGGAGAVRGPAFGGIFNRLPGQIAPLALAGAGVSAGFRTIEEMNRSPLDDRINADLMQRGEGRAMLARNMPGGTALTNWLARSGPGIDEQFLHGAGNLLGVGTGQPLQRSTLADAEQSQRNLDRQRQRMAEESRRRREREEAQQREESFARDTARDRGRLAIEGQFARGAAQDQIRQMSVDTRLGNVGARLQREQQAMAEGSDSASTRADELRRIDEERERQRRAGGRVSVRRIAELDQERAAVEGGQTGLGALQAEARRAPPPMLQAEVRRNDELLTQARRELNDARRQQNVEQEAGPTGTGTRDLGTIQAEAARAAERASQRVRELEEERVAIVTRQGQMTQQHFERIRSLAAQTEQSYQQIAERERQRNRTFAESFGMMGEDEQRAIRDVAQRAETSRQQTGDLRGLSNEDLALLQRTGVGGEFAREEGARRANAGGVADIIRQLGGQQREEQARAAATQAAQVRVEMENQITANVEINAESVATTLAERLAPAIIQAMQMIRQRTGIELDQRLAREAMERSNQALGSAPS